MEIWSVCCLQNHVLCQAAFALRDGTPMLSQTRIACFIIRKMANLSSTWEEALSSLAEQKLRVD
jgi:hypothetical protein